jgi:hypothetical protein
MDGNWLKLPASNTNKTKPSNSPAGQLSQRNLNKTTPLLVSETPRPLSWTQQSKTKKARGRADLLKVQRRDERNIQECPSLMSQPFIHGTFKYFQSLVNPSSSSGLQRLSLLVEKPAARGQA